MTSISALRAEDPVVAILSSQAAKPYQQTVRSFQAELRRKRPAVELIRSGLGDDTATIPPSAVVFALGSRAVRESLALPGERPVVATLIISGQELHTAHATAVLLRTSARKQLEWHRRVLPKLTRVGILYDPRYNQDWVDEARQAAAGLGLTIVAVPVSSAKKLPSALKVLSREADSILGLADKTVYSGKTAKAVLLFSFRNRIPFIGLSSAWAKAGALYALDWDYASLGRQCAALALRLLAGEKASTIAPQLAARQIYHVNLKTAKHLKRVISRELVDGAGTVYE